MEPQEPYGKGRNPPRPGGCPERERAVTSVEVVGEPHSPARLLFLPWPACAFLDIDCVLNAAPAVPYSLLRRSVPAEPKKITRLGKAGELRAGYPCTCASGNRQRDHGRSLSMARFDGVGAAVRNGAAAAHVPSQRDLRPSPGCKFEVYAKEVPADP